LAAGALSKEAQPLNEEVLMDKRISAALLATFATLSLAGCENMTRQEKGMATGAVVGGVVGSAATDGSTLGTVGGAVAGGVVGKEVAKR